MSHGIPGGWPADCVGPCVAVVDYDPDGRNRSNGEDLGSVVICECSEFREAKPA